MKTERFKILFFGAMLGVASVMSAAAPAGYYDSCKGKKGADLLKALERVIGSHTNVGYKGLWSLYATSDVDANGKIWDMYSTKRWNVGKEQCGNYSKVGDCYNREHSFPKSWFDDASPMYSDGFHIYPTDGKVNGQRSNYPYGECAGGETLSSSGSVKALGRLGTCTFPGYSGKVFEPDDEYKGDFARSYFYMASCYNSRISSWNSDMLAGNSFPVFTTWAKNLLMKWHKEDPVSDKERKRNEAVYAAQGNRNPFIDNPDMADHIWGDLASTGWGDGGDKPVVNPAFTSPVNGSTIDMGTAVAGHAKTSTVTVRGTNFTQNTSVTVSGAGFSVSPATLSASQVMAGTSVTVSLNSNQAGSHTATLTLTSGTARTSVTVKANVLKGLAAGHAVNVSATGFDATWVNATGSSSATYQLHVAQGNASSELQGYPVSVRAADERHRVTGLEPSTAYRYWLSDGSQTSNIVNVTTHGLTPELYLEPGNDLVFATTPGVASDAVTIFIDAYNVDGDIRVSVTAPFEVSLDKESWATSLTLGEDDGQFYLRLNGDNAGVFRTSVTATALDCFNDDLSAEGVIESEHPLTESFEKDCNFGYSGSNKEGDIARWDFADAGVFDDTREVRTGRQGVRFNSAEGGTVTMHNPLGGGIASVTFHTRLWDDEPAHVEMAYSLDHGASWTPAVTVAPSTAWQATTTTLNLDGDVMIRFTKTDGARVALDDIELTPMQTNIELPETTSTWDARPSADGRSIIVNNPFDSLPLDIYTLDGALVWRGDLPQGTTLIPLERDHYIAVSAAESRRIVIR